MRAAKQAMREAQRTMARGWGGEGGPRVEIDTSSIDEQFQRLAERLEHVADRLEHRVDGWSHDGRNFNFQFEPRFAPNRHPHPQPRVILRGLAPLPPIPPVAPLAPLPPIPPVLMFVPALPAPPAPPAPPSARARRRSAPQISVDNPSNFDVSVDVNWQ
jgi:uncharacterized protein YukE